MSLTVKWGELLVTLKCDKGHGMEEGHLKWKLLPRSSTQLFVISHEPGHLQILRIQEKIPTPVSVSVCHHQASVHGASPLIGPGSRWVFLKGLPGHGLASHLNPLLPDRASTRWAHWDSQVIFDFPSERAQSCSGPWFYCPAGVLLGRVCLCKAQ